MKKYKLDKETLVLILLLMMFIGGVFGYIYEVIFYKIDTGKFINRGTTIGPWIPIYAFGSLLIYLTTYKVKDKWPLVLLISAISCGLLEYITGYLLFNISGTRLWNYNTEILNYGNIGGFVCARSIIFFGLSGCFLVYGIVPLLKKFATKISKQELKILSLSLFSLFFIDFLYSSILSKIF